MNMLLLRRIQIAIFLTSLLCVSGCERVASVRKYFANWRSGKKIEIATTKSASHPDKLAYFFAKKGTLSDVREIRSKLQASEKVEIRADKAMRISPAKVAQYAKVKRGDILFTVDTRELEAKRLESKERVEQLKIDIKAAGAQLEFADKQFERKQALIKKGIVAQKELDEAKKLRVAAETQGKTKELELRKAVRELENLEQSVQSANIVSSIDGIVTTIVPGGDNVNLSQTIAVISNPASLSVYATVDESLVTLLPAGTKVKVKLDVFPDRLINAVVRTSIAAIKQDGLNKGYELQIDLDPEQAKRLDLRDGYEATTIVNFGERQNVVSVPLAAIKMNGGQAFLLVASSRGSVPSARAVKIGMRTELEAEVMEGIKEGEFVTAEGIEAGGQP